MTVTGRWRTLGVIGLGIGVALRCARLVEARSFWLDESMTALNIAPRGWESLLGPPLYQQAIPPGFLILTRLLVAGLGASDWVFRVLPTVGAIVLLLLLFRPLGARLLGDRGGAIVITFAALSPLLLQYGDTVKPYGFDALAAVALPLLALRALDHPSRSTRWFGLITGGMIAMTLGFASIFVAAGVGIGIAVSPKAWVRPVRRWLGVVGTAWIGWFSKRVIVAMLVVPSALGLIAGVAHRYPLSHRLWLFCVPSVVILVAGGVEFALRAAKAGWQSTAARPCTSC